MESLIPQLILLEKKSSIINSKQNKRKKVKQVSKKIEQQIKEMKENLQKAISQIDEQSREEGTPHNAAGSDWLESAVDSYSFDLISGAFGTKNLHKKVG